MRRKLISFDWAIKRILRSKANFEILEGFLSELLFEDITILEILESESNQEQKNDKFNRLDIKVKNQKQEINIGKRNNQTFVQIPFDKLLSMLEYKANLVGIEVVYQEESYTSKADSLTKDELPIYEKDSHKRYSFSGKRVKRGLYQSSIGVLLNADINSALNIARKVIGDSFISLFDRGLWCNPLKIRVIEPNSLQRFLNL